MLSIQHALFIFPTIPVVGNFIPILLMKELDFIDKGMNDLSRFLLLRRKRLGNLNPGNYPKAQTVNPLV